MNLRAPARALLGRTARLRWVHLVLGGALLMPFWLVAGLVALPLLHGGSHLFSGSVPAQFAAYVLALPLAAVAGLFPLMRPLSVAMARALSGVAADRFADGPAHGPAARRRTAAWFTLHLGVGALLSGMMLALPPFAVSVMLLPIDGVREWLRLPASFDSTWVTVLAPFAGLAMLLSLAACASAAGALLARYAPDLLGPTPTDRLAAAEARAAELAIRNRLARELHDSVGHALSAVTLQAAAARRLLDSDPGFVREALAAIEDTTRRTVGELDAVLGLLREGDEAAGGDASAAAPAPTLAGDLDGLLTRTRATGTPVDASIESEVAKLPALVSREAYRIVQEGLANSLRHGGSSPDEPITLRITETDDMVEIAMENRLRSAAAPTRPGGGSGLKGIADRARLLGGTCTAGPDDGRWRLAVRLPLATGGPR